MTKREMRELLKRCASDNSGDAATFYDFAEAVIAEHLGIDPTTIDYAHAHSRVTRGWPWNFI